MYYSPSTRGFYDSAIHGDNIPPDAVDVTTEAHAALMQAQSEGKAIVPGPDGRPVAADPPPPTPTQLIDAQIAVLEASVTQRRIREAALTATGKAWMADVDAQIAALRKQRG